jgi:hypothetical protein
VLDVYGLTQQKIGKLYLVVDRQLIESAKALKLFLAFSVDASP